MKRRTSAHCEEVIIHEEEIGIGLSEEDPCRILTVVRKKDGTFIAEHDAWAEEEKKKKAMGENKKG